MSALAATPIPQPLAAYRHKLERLIEITGRPQPAPVPGDYSVGISPEVRSALNKEYQTLLRWFDEAAAQLPTQPAALDAEQ